MLHQQKRNDKQRISLSETYSGSLPNLKDTLMKHAHVLQANQTYRLRNLPTYKLIKLINLENYNFVAITI